MTLNGELLDFIEQASSEKPEEKNRCPRIEDMPLFSIVCVKLSVRKRKRLGVRYKHICLFLSVYECLLVYVCVCEVCKVRVRERMKEKERER